MTKTVLVIGCSWSRSFEDLQKDQEDTFWSWPELLAKDLGEDWNVWNYSSYCNSLEHQNLLLYWLLEKYHNVITHVILQHTSANRITMLEDALSYRRRIEDINILKNTHKLNNYLQLPESLVTNWSTTKPFDQLGAAHLNHGTVQNRKRWSSTFQDMTLHYTGVTDHFGSIIQHDMKRLVESYNKHCISYRHFYYPDFFKDTDVLNRDRSYLDFILQYDMPNFEDYTIDNGYHFSKSGNQRIVSDWILPRLLENV
tara:strand:+ start:2710 stop:3474 length:765 start_codon:yes stop_codon:yes gene_type:complete